MKYINPFKGFHWISMFQIFVSVFIVKETEQWDRSTGWLQAQLGSALGFATGALSWSPSMYERRMVISSSQDCGDSIRCLVYSKHKSDKTIKSIKCFCMWYQSGHKAFSHHKIIKVLILSSSNTLTGSCFSFFTFTEICFFKVRNRDLLLFSSQIIKQLFYYHLFIFFHWFEC